MYFTLKRGNNFVFNHFICRLQELKHCSKIHELQFYIIEALIKDVELYVYLIYIIEIN